MKGTEDERGDVVEGPPEHFGVARLMREHAQCWNVLYICHELLRGQF